MAAIDWNESSAGGGIDLSKAKLRRILLKI
jgi:hypothetical protein